ncbi:helix-turn-helix domain-containing protein [Porcincola intestinalis]|jgi:excisionase family DNA binding protein|uniref:helix-turn-helix domain-containing protein n=1 Tax=Porcincola intestinalis TaxID=2606632 RepID=UPI001B02E13E|nr:helix-turn-helix domain-containing protein [Porcincola intestinalis]MBO5569578.1 helix-turn-helix domain-containing protein [Clostridia bacterium]MBO6267757.1 helix-turn-helix domain-containing protein [Clostridium sp.]MBP3803988.1 helix-turn-helix domain-containing protein [Oribacterium sp.]MCI1654150.1 helix-turn-helix domain-containing protein [Lachnospiraceae bacterium]MCI1655941.1 helix-turn-helix domain-containing protein [Lachnospiraceae bacterium]
MFEEKIEEMNREPIVTAASGAEYGKRTYTVDEIQDILDISRSSAYNLVKKNLFRSVRIGGHIRVSKRSFDEWLDTQL